jgi:hypothetical protein
LKEKNSDDILPVIFSDNYISLAPGESRTIECSYENKDAGNGVPLYIRLQHGTSILRAVRQMAMQVSKSSHFK